MKKDSMYLGEVWEEWGDDINYFFTQDISKAMSFFKYELTSEQGAPKYLWDDINKKSISTVKEMCEFFDGEMVEIAKQITWKETCRIV